MDTRETVVPVYKLADTLHNRAKTALAFDKLNVTFKVEADLMFEISKTLRSVADLAVLESERAEKAEADKKDILLKALLHAKFIDVLRLWILVNLENRLKRKRKP